MTKHEAGHSGGATTHHVLVGTANIRCDNFQDDGVVQLTPIGSAQHWIINVTNFDFTRAHIYNASIPAHVYLLQIDCADRSRSAYWVGMCGDLPGSQAYSAYRSGRCSVRDMSGSLISMSAKDLRALV
ncbi:hypothetical protein D3C79_933920 [compost metagenome]